MTKDTERALEALKEVAKILSIEIDADESWLYCNGQPIGISCNSAYATVNEFIGYAMLNMAKRESHRFTVSSTLKKQIQSNWRTPEQVADIKKRLEEYWNEKNRSFN